MKNKFSSNKSKNIIVLGSTGSVGKQSLEVIRNYPDKFKVVGMAALGEDIKSQIKEFKPEIVYVDDESVRSKLSINPASSLEELVSYPQADTIIVAIPGTVALEAVFKAIEQKKQILLATKEISVVAGSLLEEKIKEYKADVLPLDSEHSAIFQCLQGEKKERIKRIILTCSGGPFRGKKKKDLEKVTKEQVVSHPVWKMGPKISIDSATLMNKGFEVIEAHHLFDIPFDKIDVVVHPQSIIHSMIEFTDGTIKALLSNPTMKYPIQYALFYPDRSLTNPWGQLELKDLTFEKPDTETFPCLEYAYSAGKTGGTMPAVLNYVDETAVDMFLKGEIKYLDIPRIVKQLLDKHKVIPNPSLEDILEIKEWVEKETRAIIK